MRLKLIDSLIKLSNIFKDGFTVIYHNGIMSQCFYHTGYIISVKTLITIQYHNDKIPSYKYNFKEKYLNDNMVIGGWFDKETNTYYIEKNIVMDNLKEALIYAKNNNQKEIFDIKNGRCIKV